MAAYLLKNIDDELWHALKARAEIEGRKVRWIVLTLFRYYVQHGLPPKLLSGYEGHLHGKQPGSDVHQTRADLEGVSREVAKARSFGEMLGGIKPKR